ncbi:hypothetical protein QJS04_geneDACA017511 [Acorus gramineus]|uniref:Uncharacterized protein n=1 Tax=Acorus gramineus TaxID=55184 RepID=A0AAV9AIH1_ACOGR|nr:hypothetical protein QJS04_geneDACA017511 [Acorus gramineus]
MITNHAGAHPFMIRPPHVLPLLPGENKPSLLRLHRKLSIHTVDSVSLNRVHCTVTVALAPEINAPRDRTILGRTSAVKSRSNRYQPKIHKPPDKKRPTTSRS